MSSDKAVKLVCESMDDRSFLFHPICSIMSDSIAQRGWPVAVTMGGGYAEKVEDIVDIHEQTVLTALELHRSLQPC